MEQVKTRLCIVGSGVAGALCAKYASSAIDDILLVERGGLMSHRERLETGHTIKHLPTTVPHYSYPEHKSFEQTYTVGGAVNWFGNTPRLLPNDFRMRSAYGVMDDWAISYDELEPFYCTAEEEMQIAGPSDHPLLPRSRPYPQPPHQLSPMDTIVAECFPPGQLVAMPQARPSRPLASRPKCCAATTCNLCPVDSKYTVLNTHYEELAKNDRVRLLPERIIISLEENEVNNRKVRYLLAKNAQGDLVRIEAETVILAANALENASILLRSDLSNHHPLEGCYLGDQTGFQVVIWTDRDVYPNYGKTVMTGHGYHFYEGPFRSERSGALIEFSNLAEPSYLFSALVEEGLRGKALRAKAAEEFRNLLTMKFLLEPLPDVQRKVEVSTERNSFGIPISAVTYPPHSGYVLSSRQYILHQIPNVFARLGVKRVFAADLSRSEGHILGTCRMGDLKTGVVDKDLRHHNYDNLYVLGGSAFTTYSPSNPTLTIAALAVRLGRHLAT